MESEQDTAIHLPVFGALTYREMHAFVDGVYVGYRGVDELEVNFAADHGYEREAHYWRAGYVAGSLTDSYTA